MSTISQAIRTRLLANAHKIDSDSYESLSYSEWSEEFEELMRNRLIMGALRYGKLGSKEKVQYDRLGGLQHHLDMYKKTGNLEHLVDIANIAVCECVEGTHPKKHFKANDESWHVKERKRNENHIV